MKSALLRLCLCMSVFTLLMGAASAARANMLITPTMVVFEGRERFESIMLVNIGDEQRTYNIEWMYFEMIGEDGTYKTTNSPPTEFDLSKHIVYSPRRVTLAPGASQKVKLALRRPSEIPDGDYRVHLKFALEPDGRDDIIERQYKDIAEDPSRSGASVSINVSYSIPVYLIVGESEVEAHIGELTMKRNEDTGALRAIIPVERTGKPYSIIGHLYVYHIDGKGNMEKVGEISNAQIFPEVNKRIFDVNLIKEVSGGSLRVVLDHYDDESELVYADKTFPLE